MLSDLELTSVNIKDYMVEVRETKLGDEQITRDIPNVSEHSLRHLDENGIVQIGSEVKAGDVLVGKITPKGEQELSRPTTARRSPGTRSRLTSWSTSCPAT